MDVADLKVGQRWSGNMHHEDGAQFEFSKAGPELRLFFSGLPDEAVREFDSAPCEIGLLHSEDVAVVPWKIGEHLMGDAQFHAFLYPPETRPSDPVLNVDQRMRLRIVLVDRASGVVRGMRSVLLSPSLSNQLAEAVSRQLGNHIGREAYDAQVAIYQNKYPDVRDAIRAAEIFETAED